MKQTSMFGEFKQRLTEQAAVESAPYQSHSLESKDAAESILPAAGTLRRRVYDFIAMCGKFGATDEEVQTALSMNPSTQRPRRIELAQARCIVANGHRKTKSGRNATVWRVTGAIQAE